MSLKIRRGTEVERTTRTFDSGELVWTASDGGTGANYHQLWVGDGITPGGVNILATSAGPNLLWDAPTRKLKVDLASITTDSISAGSMNTRQYYSTEKAQDDAALLFTSGTHSGITFDYLDADGKINVTVNPTAFTDLIGITAISQDTAPSLGGNLSLNTRNITGTGNINITGYINASAGYKGNIVNADGTPLFDTEQNRITLYNVTSAFARFYGNQAGDHTSWVEFYSSNGSLATPTPVQQNDKLSGMILNSWNGTTYDKSVVIGGLADANVVNNQVPGKFVVQNTNSTGTGYETLTFDSKGLLSVKTIKVADVAGTLPSSPQAGMIVLDGSTFKGYNGTAWVNLN